MKLVYNTCNCCEQPATECICSKVDAFFNAYWHLMHPVLIREELEKAS